MSFSFCTIAKYLTSFCYCIITSYNLASASFCEITSYLASASFCYVSVLILPLKTNIVYTRRTNCIPINCVALIIIVVRLASTRISTVSSTVVCLETKINFVLSRFCIVSSNLFYKHTDEDCFNIERVKAKDEGANSREAIDLAEKICKIKFDRQNKILVTRQNKILVR